MTVALHARWLGIAKRTGQIVALVAAIGCAFAEEGDDLDVDSCAIFFGVTSDDVTTILSEIKAGAMSLKGNRPVSESAIRMRRKRDRDRGVTCDASHSVTCDADSQEEGQESRRKPQLSRVKVASLQASHSIVTCDASQASLFPPHPPIDNSSSLRSEEIIHETRVSEKAPKRTRGTRIDPEAQPSEDDIAFALKNGMTDDEVMWFWAEYVDFWASQSGSKAVKTDWPRTWKNRVRFLFSQGIVARHRASKSGASPKFQGNPNGQRFNNRNGADVFEQRAAHVDKIFGRCREPAPRIADDFDGTCLESFATRRG